MQAINIVFMTPTAARGTRVKAFAIGANMVSIGYDHEVGNEENAQAALDAFLAANPSWAGEWVIASQRHDYVAVMVPKRFVKARDAVILTRRAISQGEHNGNPHCKPWGQAITDLTDGVQPDGFSSEYANAVAKGL